MSIERLRLLAYLLLTLAAFVLLASGISGVQLKRGEILFKPPREVTIEDDGLTEPSVTPASPTSPNSLLGLLAVAALLAAGYAAVRSREVRAGVIAIIVFGGIYLGIIQLYRIYYTPPEEEVVDTQGILLSPERLSDELFEQAPELVDLVSLLTTVAVVVVALVASWLLWRYRELLFNRKPPLVIISDEVEAALRDLRAGANLKDTVMRCYYDMGQALGTGLGLVRNEGVTPREFEQVLSESGLPAQSIQQLTRLFEKVRYGGQIASDREKTEAMSCLEAIVSAAGDQMRRVTI